MLSVRARAHVFMRVRCVRVCRVQARTEYEEKELPAAESILGRPQAHLAVVRAHNHEEKKNLSEIRAYTTWGV